MFGFGRFGRVRQRTRRLLAAVGAAVLLGSQAFSSAYIALEADHDCCGEGCPVCFQIQQCAENLQLTGSGLEADAAVVSLPSVAADLTVPTEVLPQSRSLVAQKVQFNE